MAARTAAMQEEIDRWRQHAQMTAMAMSEAKNELMTRKRDIDMAQQRMDSMLGYMAAGPGGASGPLSPGGLYRGVSSDMGQDGAGQGRGTAGGRAHTGGSKAPSASSTKAASAPGSDAHAVGGGRGRGRAGPAAGRGSAAARKLAAGSAPPVKFADSGALLPPITPNNNVQVMLHNPSMNNRGMPNGYYSYPTTSHGYNNVGQQASPLPWAGLGGMGNIMPQQYMPQQFNQYNAPVYPPIASGAGNPMGSQFSSTSSTYGGVDSKATVGSTGSIGNPKPPLGKAGGKAAGGKSGALKW